MKVKLSAAAVVAFVLIFSVAETRLGEDEVTYFGALGNWWVVD